jgi:hypothetical protein
MTYSSSTLIQSFCLLIPTIHLAVVAFFGAILSLVLGQPIGSGEQSTIVNYLFIGSPAFLLFNCSIFLWHINHKNQPHKYILWAIISSCLYLFSISMLDNEASKYSYGYLILCILAIYNYRGNRQASLT